MTRIQTFFDERTSTLTHLVYDPKTQDALVIDPVLDFEPSSGRLWDESLQRVDEFVRAHGLSLHLALETHPHADHLSGGQWLRRNLESRVGIHQRVVESQRAFQPIFDLDARFATDGTQFDLLLAGDSTLHAGSLEVKVLPTPGHTPACASFLIDGAVFTGDALFLDDVGVARCDFPGGDAGTLYDSITQWLWTLPPDTRVYPGHDYPPAGRRWADHTTIGSSREKNVHLYQGLSREAFVERRTARDRTLSPPRLLYPAVQVNIDAGRLPPPNSEGRRFLKLPLKPFEL